IGLADAAGFGSAAVRRRLVHVLKQIDDARSPAHGAVLQLLLSLSQQCQDSVDPDVADAVVQAIWLSDCDDVARSAVKSLPMILKAVELSPVKLRGLVQRAWRMVPDAVIQCGLHSLLGLRNPHDLPGPMEQDISQPDPSEVPTTITLSDSCAPNAATEGSLSQQASYIPAGSS
ncbi:unnamed protein product, partial [Symbiodinium pilosum]